jgi:hypothetical protein
MSYDGSAGNEALNTVTVNTLAGLHDVTGFAALIREFLLKAILQGPYNATTDVMSTNLKSLGYLPTVSPYNVSETVANQDAIPNDVVDWILVELVDPNNSATVYGAQSAFLKSNGDITNLANSPIVSFSNVNQSSVSIRLKHRNHLSVRTEAQVLSGVPLEFDFRLGTGIFTIEDFMNANVVNNGQPMKLINSLGVHPSRNALWAGDINKNGQLKYNGANNDREIIYARIGSGLFNVTVNGYWDEDLNLNGQVKYNAINNDREILYSNIGAGLFNKLVNAHN